ncbi:VOC family protein [Flavobacterium sp. D11R37]|uniref:VOC family protein n=1 Tax=Flavobacterium coralii TaxID=2838017 RepID=UPI001CA62804|nr:VOC family protein [Flavobacterium coralii]MBY8962373.1 VOC family protein [Flavobacterium coralii]
MLQDCKAFSSFPTDDIAKTRQFYEGVLGLKATEGMGGMVLDFEMNGSVPFIIYQKPDHRPADFTVFNFLVDDIGEAVASLKDKGVVFENYDNGNIKTDEDNIFRGEGPLVAWFKDPSGNILSLVQE